MGKFKKANRVTKSNDMNQAILHKKSTALGLNEQKIALGLISLISPKDEDLKPYVLSTKAIQELTGIARTKITGESLNNICASLVGTVFVLRKEKKIITVPFFQKAERDCETGLIEFIFSPELKPYLLNLKGSFTSYHFTQVAALKSAYSIRMYEILRQKFSLSCIKKNISKKTFEISISDLRLFLHIDEKKYKATSDFISQVVKNTQRELLAKSDLEFSYISLKRCNKVIGLEITVQQNKKYPIKQVEAEIKQANDALNIPCRDLEMAEYIFLQFDELEWQQAVILINAFDKSIIHSAFFELSMAKNKKEIKNRLAYFKAILNKKQSEQAQNQSYGQKTMQEKLTDRSWDTDDIDVF